MSVLQLIAMIHVSGYAPQFHLIVNKGEYRSGGPPEETTKTGGPFYRRWGTIKIPRPWSKAIHGHTGPLVTLHGNSDVYVSTLWIFWLNPFMNVNSEVKEVDKWVCWDVNCLCAISTQLRVWQSLVELALLLNTVDITRTGPLAW